MPLDRTGLQNFSVIREIYFQSNQTRLCPRQLANLLPFLGWHMERNIWTWENQRYFSPVHIVLGQSIRKRALVFMWHPFGFGSTYKHKLLDTSWQSLIICLKNQQKNFKIGFANISRKIGRANISRLKMSIDSSWQ